MTTKCDPSRHLLAVFSACAGLAAGNPATSHEHKILTVTLPDTPPLEFVVVPLGIGDKPFAARECWLGGRGTASFREPLVRCMIAGSMVISLDGNPDWCILIGKTEVTIAQWNAVLAGGASGFVPKEGSPNLPVTGITRLEVATFLEQINKRLGPLQGRTPEWKSKTFSAFVDASLQDVFFRLPTEAEWEYSARGGAAVSPDVFGNPTPYSDALNHYEWFDAQNSSRGKLKEVALLRPNPLGIHDMLGNCSEMVEGYYLTEFLQGRVGGNLVRGGDYRSPETGIRSSMRQEVPAISDEGNPYHSRLIGLRLAIGSAVISSGIKISDLDDAWVAYSETRIQPSSAHSSTAALTETSGKELESIAQAVKNLAANIGVENSSSAATTETLKLIETQTASVRGQLNRSEQFFARGAVSLASVACTETVSSIAEKIIIEKKFDKLQKSDELTGEEKAKLIGSMENWLEKTGAKITSAGNSMEEACAMFGEVSPDTIKKAYQDRYEKIEKLMTNPAASKDLKDNYRKQIEVARISERLVNDYLKTRRFDREQWRKDLGKLAEPLAASISDD